MFEFNFEGKILRWNVYQWFVWEFNKNCNVIHVLDKFRFTIKTNFRPTKNTNGSIKRLYKPVLWLMKVSNQFFIHFHRMNENCAAKRFFPRKSFLILTQVFCKVKNRISNIFRCIICSIFRPWHCLHTGVVCVTIKNIFIGITWKRNSFIEYVIIIFVYIVLFVSQANLNHSVDRFRSFALSSDRISSEC